MGVATPKVKNRTLRKLVSFVERFHMTVLFEC
jgi:hypothetical protein